MFLQKIISRQFRTNTCFNCDKRQPAATVQELLENAATFQDANTDDTHETDWATLPYPEGTVLRRDQSKKSLRPKVDPKETSIILFPGQGSQYVGMARNLVRFPKARDLFEMASSVLK